MMLDKILQSSQNPEKVSLTVKGTLMNVLAFVVFAAGAAGYQMVGDTGQVVETVSSITGTALVLVGQFQVVWGLIRKMKIVKK